MPDDVVRYYATVVQGLSVQSRDGATRDEFEAVITYKMAAWDTLTSTASNTEVARQFATARPILCRWSLWLATATRDASHHYRRLPPTLRPLGARVVSELTYKRRRWRLP